MKRILVTLLLCAGTARAEATPPAPPPSTATAPVPPTATVPPPATPPAATTATPPTPATPPTAVAQADMPATASAAPAPPPPVVTLARPAPSRTRGRLLTYASFGFNAYTYLGATASAPTTNLTPASRGIIYQQVGLGYFVHPMLRLQLTFIFGETVTGRPAGTDTLSAFAIVPWLIFTTHGFFTGAGPQLAPVSYGKAGKFDAGIYSMAGYAVKLGRGFSLPLGVQFVLMLNQRTSFAITPSVALAYRF